MSRINPSVQITCICGSTRFKNEMLEVAQYLELDCGRIVVMPNVYGNYYGVDLQKHELDRLVSIHDQKIKMSDEVYIVDAPGGDGKPYIGESTAREIQLAQKEGKEIEYLSRDKRFQEFNELYRRRIKK